MKSRGLRRYHEQRRALAEARNITGVRTLEGVGSEERLRTLQRRFKRLRAARAGDTVALPLACAAMFGGVLAAGFLLDRIL